MGKKLVVEPSTKPDTFTTKAVSGLVVDTDINTRLADQAVADRAAPKPTLGEGWSAAWNSETATAAIFDYLGSKGHAPDPNFKIGNYDWAEITKGISPQYHGAILNSVSEEDMRDKISKIIREQDNQQTLGRMGGTGMLLSMGAAVLDPVGTGLSLAAAPLAGSAKLGRMANVLRGGAAGAAVNTALETGLYAEQDTRDGHDVLMAGLLGFGFGNIGGYLSPHKAKGLTQTANDLHEVLNLERVKRGEVPDVSLTPEGAARHTELTSPVPAKVTTVEAAMARIKALADSASEEVADHLSAKAAAFDEMLAARAARVAAQEEADAVRRIADTEAATLHPDIEQRDDVKEFLDDVGVTPAQEAPSSTIKPEDDQVPQKEPSVQPEAPTQATEALPAKTPEDAVPHKVGDDIVVETADGDFIGGRIKAYNHETGRMVILDDATDKPRVVNMNEVVNAETSANVTHKDGGSGFDPKGSVGSAKLADTDIHVGDDAAFLEFKIPFTNIKVPLRFDYYAKFARSENPTMKKLGAMLLSNSVGDKHHYARGANASEIAHLEWNVQKGRYVTANEEAYDAYAKEQGWGWFEKEKNRRAFNEKVTEAIRGDSTNQYVDPHVGKVVMEIQKIHTEILEKMKKYGVEGAEEVLPNPFYMMRRFNHEKILQLKSRFAPEELQKVIAGALRSVRPLDELAAAKIAKQYYNVVTAIPYEDMGRMRMGEAGIARLRVVAEGAKVDPELLEDVIRLVMNKPDDVAEGSSSRLKHRTMMNENFKTEITGKDGQTYTVAMSDFFENDAGVLMDMYTRQTGGLIGLAQVGIRSEADWTKLMAEAAHDANKGNANAAKNAKERKHMEDVYNHILGRPMSDEIYGTTERVLKGLRDFNFFRLMGQVGVAQVAELAATLATAGTRAMAMHMPAYKDVIRMAKLGQIDDELQRDMLNMAGFGAEMRGQQSLGRNAEDVFHDPKLSKAENVLNEGRKAIAMVSGLAPITNIMRQLSARMFAQKMLDYAHGFTKMPESQLKRMAWMGIDENNIDAVFRDMKTHMKIDSAAKGKLTGIEWEAWEKANPETYQTFRMALWRESRRVVQESTIGETAPWMHTQMGKVLTQFRGFMMVAHAKNTLNNLHHRDMEGAQVFMASMLATSLAYMAQTSANYAGDKEKLDEMLAIDKVAAAAFQRTGFSSLIPSVLDTSLGIAGHDPLFRNSRVSGQANSLITGNATYDLAVNKLGGTAKNILQNFTTDDYQATQNDVKTGMQAVLPNVFGVRNLINATAAKFPKYNDLRDYSQQ